MAKKKKTAKTSKVHKQTTKQKKSQIKNQSSKLFNYLLFALIIIALLIGLILVGYSFGYQDAIEKPISHPIPSVPKSESIEKKPSQIHIASMQEKEKKEHTIQNVPQLQKKLHEVLTQKRVPYNSASHEIDEKQEPKSVVRKTMQQTIKPKLAIIIDDVCTKSHIQNIKQIHIPLTMSFLPPSKARPNSAKLASKENFYMVHLPMEAMHFNAPEPLTLKVQDSQYTILKRIKTLKELFPHVHYINNHTGSKFTSDEVAVNRLIYALNKYNINFIDSRTTAKTKVPKVMKNFGYKYMARDVFLDHKHEKEYALKQIKQAVKVAKKYGTAIAIGHPHKNTLWALNQAKKRKYFQDIELVYINQLY